MYIDVISLSTAKNHLRVDLDFTADDLAIERMIRSACELIEKNTAHYLYARDITYNRNRSDQFITVFDYPINSIVENDVIALNYSLKTQYRADTVTLNVGYANPTDVPSALIDCALMLIDSWYYESETKGNTNNDMPLEAQRIIMNYKRCIVV